MEPRKRKRGIRASREKIETAMIDAGFKTQNALAKQIAIDEGIEKPPKDLVSKIFNEKPVSVSNLARVAKALNVEPHAIYLAKDDLQVSDVLQSQQDESLVPQNVDVVQKPYSHAQRNWLFVLMGSAFLLAFVYWLWTTLFNITSNEGLLTKPDNTQIISPLGKVLIVIQSTNETHELAQLLLQDLTTQNKLNVILPERPDSYQLSNEQSLSQWQAHGVLRISFEQGEFYNFVSAEFASQAHTKTLMQLFMNTDEFAVNSEHISSLISQQVSRFVEGQTLLPIFSDSEQALQEYVKGLNQLFVSHSDNEYIKADLHFSNAIELDPRFSQAYAQNCKTKVRESWIKEELSLLEEASVYCGTAEKLAPNDLVTIVANAELLSRTGEPDQAVSLGRSIFQQNIVSADAFASLSEILLVQSKSDSNEQIQLEIVSLANQAIELESRHWRAYNTLGNFYFSQGQIALAKAQFEQASKIVVHEVTMGNLGTMQMCFDELDAAESTYRKLIDSFDNNALGHENLGTVFLFKKQYQQALEQKLIAIEKQPEIAIHQVWSGLAEAYLRSEQLNAAYENYVKALTIIERDELLNNATLTDSLFKLYYKVKMQSIRPENPVVQDYREQVATFYETRGQIGLKARSHLAWLAGTLNENELKASLIKEITSVCPVYFRSPELLNQT